MKLFLTLFVVLGLVPFTLSAHCQLPCGIYHDDLRFASLEEDVQTLYKAIAEIKANSTGSLEGNNQLVRSVNLKDEYADKIVHTMTFYFLQQRLKPGQKNLGSMLNSSFIILQLSAQIKASIEASLVDKLSQEITKFKELYKQID